METTFDHLVYESDESSTSKLSSSSRGRRRSGRNLLKSDAPTRRSSRISTIQMAAEIERSISGDLDDSVSVESEKSIKLKTRGRKAKTSVSSDDVFNLEKILGATAINGHLQFVMKWKDRDEPTLMSSEDAKTKYTMHVLEYYESQMIWESDDEK